ncbi:unnamed protein product [Pneumocystis jirovecii]|uniref:Chloride channel protein n=1 Tax=Pneumocystis jirovecii TaxID=42068 RepID=L0PAI4_PNEJI|nr:unnamed protein product [Pneumocystis jirovecii]
MRFSKLVIDKRSTLCSIHEMYRNEFAHNYTPNKQSESFQSERNIYESVENHWETHSFSNTEFSLKRESGSTEIEERSIFVERLEDKNAAFIGSTIKHIFSRLFYEKCSESSKLKNFSTIDWVDENTKERDRKQTIRKLRGIWGKIYQFWDFSQLWVIIITTGISIGVISGFIDIVSGWLSDIREGYCKSGFYLNRNFCCWVPQEDKNKWKKTCHDWVSWKDAFNILKKESYIVSYIFYIIFVTLFGLISSFLVNSYACYAKNSGISEIKIILSGFVMHRFLGKWTLIIKSLSVCLSIASGLWIGKEGPLIHIACCCADFFFKIFSTAKENQAKKREILSAAAAAGTSVAFGAPIGGVLFALEQLSYYFPEKTMWRSFVCAMISAMSLKFINPFRDGRLVIYQAFFKVEWYSFELIPISLLGVIGGLYGFLFIKFNKKILKLKSNYKITNYPVQEVLVVTFITGLINYSNVLMKFQHSNLLAQLFKKCSENDTIVFCLKENIISSIFILLYATIFGIFLSCISFGLQVPSGIILPSMVIGALYGRLIGIILQYIQHKIPSAWVFSACKPDIECVAPEIYSIIGAASAVAGVTRMTVSLVIIMFELTGALTYVLPIMIAVMISKWVSDAFGKYGIYESWIYLNSYPYLSKELKIKNDTIENYITRANELVTIAAKGHTIKSLG